MIRSHKQGFTLVELLVVLALLVSLLAILTPAVGRARRVTRRTVCGSNLRQIGEGIVMYAVGSRGTAPGPSWYGNHAGYTKNSKTLARWLAPILGYPDATNNSYDEQHVNRLFYCPDFDRVAPQGFVMQEWMQFGAMGDDPHAAPGSAAYQRRVFGYPPFDGDPEGPPKRLNTMSHPSDTPALRDIDKWLHPTTWGGRAGDSPSHGSRNGFAIRNYLYFDWHVEYQLEP